MPKPVIEVSQVRKDYRSQRGGRVLLGKRGLSDWIRGKRSTISTALQDIDFTVEAGEAFGIIGANGSGKSTLLKLISGVTIPSQGNVTVHGRVASLLELGAGFHPMLTGRENIYLNAGILGLTHAEVDSVFEDIVEFSGIGAYIDKPVDTYSSGMYVRLGFSVAAYTNPDIFLIDEVLAVGDEAFQRKCRGRIGELIEEGKTLVFVSHDLELVNSLCQRVLLLNEGKMVLNDRSPKVIEHYLHQIVSDEIPEDAAHPKTNIECGNLRATFSQGQIRLTYKEEQLTHGLHVYTSILTHTLWNDSTKLRWEQSESIDHGGYRFIGISRRFPYQLIWEVRPGTQDSIDMDITIECSGNLRLQEFHTSICLPTAYTHWTSDHEAEAFEELTPSQSDWQHLNTNYAHGHTLEASSDTQPKVRFLSNLNNENGPVCMTPINTDYYENARVLQALRTGNQSPIHLTPGRHHFFSGSIQVGQ